MANDLNHCSFIGRLGQDPDVKYLPSGSAVANISLAVGEQWKDKNTGERQERTEWVRCCAFGKLAEIMGQYLVKGSQCYVSGKLRTRKWTTQTGEDRYSTEIVVDQMQMLGGKSESRGGGGGYNAPAASERAPAEPFDDDIPFLTSEGVW